MPFGVKNRTKPQRDNRRGRGQPGDREARGLQGERITPPCSTRRARPGVREVMDVYRGWQEKDRGRTPTVGYEAELEFLHTSSTGRNGNVQTLAMLTDAESVRT